VLWLDKRWNIDLSGSRGYFESEDVLFEEILLDIQILLEGPTVDGLGSLTIMVGAIFFHFRK